MDEILERFSLLPGIRGVVVDQTFTSGGCGLVVHAYSLINAVYFFSRVKFLWLVSTVKLF